VRVIEETQEAFKEASGGRLYDEYKVLLKKCDASWQREETISKTWQTEHLLRRRIISDDLVKNKTVTE